MTREEAIALVREVSNYMATRPEIDEAIDMAIKALEQKPSEDLISRKEVIDGLEYEAEMLKRALDNMYVCGQEREKFAWGLGLVECFIEDIKELPSKEIINMKSVFNLLEDAERGEEE